MGELLAAWPYFFTCIAFSVVCAAIDAWLDWGDEKAFRTTECPDVPRAGDSTTSAPQG